MNKLQLYIAKSMHGYKSLVNLNPAEDVRRHVADYRDVLALVDYDTQEKNIFYLLQYIAEGTLLTILRTIPSEPLNHLAATVFVPAESAITADELDAVVRNITRKMSAPGMSADDIAELRQLFARDWPDKPADDCAAMVESAQGDYACACYGGGTGRTLADYMGENLYQPEWIGYAGVLLLDADLELTASVPDLTSQALHIAVPLLPPDAQQGGFEPHIYGRPFDRPYLVGLDTTVQIEWTRPGFEPRTTSIRVDRPGMTAAVAATDDARKSVSRASFRISSVADHAPLDADATITVNGKTIGDEPISFTEAELAAARVSVTCPGYAPYSGRMDLAGSTVAHIRLSASGRIYKFQMPVRAAELGAPVTFEIRSKQPITDSPIEGYDSLDTIREGAGRINMLAYAGGARSIKRTIIAVAAGLVLGLLLGFCIFAGGGDEQVKRTRDSVPAAPAAQPAPTAPADTVAAPAVAPAPATPAPAVATANESLAEAIEYLDSHRNWKRSEMEQFAALAGLFDDMNHLRINEITGKWADKLKDSKNFTAVVRAAKGGLSKHTDFHRKNRTTFNADGDESIGYVGYTYWIDP